MAADPQAGQLVFDAARAAQFEAAYVTRDVTQRRRLVLEALAVRPGERVLDVGCGPGFFAAELLERVGPQGTVTAVDRSSAMLELAARRAPGATLAEADATSLPLQDAAFDVGVSVQVLEYVPDVPAALAEMHRVLVPGGRVLVWDADWSTVSLAAADAQRSRRVMAAWDAHLADPVLPRRLAPLLREAGFADVAVTAHAFATTAFDPETYAGWILPLAAEYAAGTGELAPGEAEAWLAELRERDDRGAFFFAVTQCCFAARRP